MATIPHVFASATSPLPLSQLDDNFAALNAAKAELTASTTPLMDGAAAIGSATTAAKADHVHPTDTEKASVAQATSAVAITGGSINSTPIGATTPSSGAFTTLSAAGLAVTGNISTTGSAQIGNSATLTWGSPYGAGVTTIQGTGSAFNIYPTGSSNGVVGAFNSQGLSLATGVNVSWGGVYGAGIPTIVGGSSGLYFYPAGSTSGAKSVLTSTGHTLIGTTTDDGVNALQVNGTAIASGNLAVGGASSSGWGSGYKALIVSAYGASMASSAPTENSVYANTLYGAVPTFVSSGYASYFQQYLGVHNWFSSSASGAAGGVVTFVNTMALSTAGNLAVTGNISSSGRTLVRTTTDDGVNALQVNGAGIFAGLIKPQQATTAGAPAYVKGAIYFDTTLNKLRVGGATAWETITSI